MAVTDGSSTRKPNKNGVRLWTAYSFHEHRKRRPRGAVNGIAQRCGRCALSEQIPPDGGRRRRRDLDQRPQVRGGGHGRGVQEVGNQRRDGRAPGNPPTGERADQIAAATDRFCRLGRLVPGIEQHTLPAGEGLRECPAARLPARQRTEAILERRTSGAGGCSGVRAPSRGMPSAVSGGWYATRDSWIVMPPSDSRGSARVSQLTNRPGDPSD